MRPVDIAVDERNLTPAATDFRIGFGATGQRDYVAGDIVGARRWVSVDNGTTWTEQSATCSAPAFAAVVDQAVYAAGMDVSLRVELTDRSGSSVQPTIITAYRGAVALRGHTRPLRAWATRRPR
ncbi:hypothetical protein [Catellatospora sp. NPDC049609]|uniref:hypothetical protein n=1 Tax=Catellatospora sp. NPDC049609 TaxID=3155505 RepID=UPI003413DC8F